MGDWTQTIATIASMLGVGVALMAYLTRQFNRINDRLDRLDGRLQNVESQQERFDERLTQVEHRLDRQAERSEQGFQAIRGDLQELAGDVQNVEIEQARMLGFLEGRGVMGKAPAEAEGT